MGDKDTEVCKFCRGRKMRRAWAAVTVQMELLRSDCFASQLGRQPDGLVAKVMERNMIESSLLIKYVEPTLVILLVHCVSFE